MTNRIRLLTAVAALALPAAFASAQVTAPPTPTPPATTIPPLGTQPGVPVSNTGVAPIDVTTDRVTDPVTEPPQQPAEATAPAAPTEDTEAEAAAEAQAQAQVQHQPMPPAQQQAPAQTQAATTAQTQASAQMPAGQLTAATVADVRMGVQVRDTTGGLVGTIESVDSQGAVVSTGAARAKIPVASFGRNNQGLVISMTKTQLEAAVAAQSNPPPAS